MVDVLRKERERGGGRERERERERERDSTAGIYFNERDCYRRGEASEN